MNSGVQDNQPSGSLPNTMPRTTLLASRPPPRTLTTRTESTLKSLGFLGITAKAASATSFESSASHPGCLEAREDETAAARLPTEGKGEDVICAATRAGRQGQVSTQQPYGMPCTYFRVLLVPLPKPSRTPELRPTGANP